MARGALYLQVLEDFEKFGWIHVYQSFLHIQWYSYNLPQFTSSAMHSEQCCPDTSAILGYL